MIGSPASRGAVASLGGAGRGCLAAASAVSAVSAAIAASVTMAAGPQRRIATVNCAVANRLTPAPVEISIRAYVDQVSDRDSWKLTGATITGKGGVRPVLRRADVAFWPERDVRAAILMSANQFAEAAEYLSLIHISEPTRLG